MNEAELLFTEVLNCDRLSLYLNKDISLDKKKSALISCVLQRRIKGEPIQYILGKTEFAGLEFKVDKNVFIPRPETEVLVEAVFNLARIHGAPLNILDIGTGSGCIGVSLAKFLSHTDITATDISSLALKVAKFNANLNNVSGKIKFIQSDMFADARLQKEKFDIIVSNPPYVVSAEIDSLAPEVRCEPRIALDGGRDGLDFYRKIIKTAPLYLKKGGFLILEIGFNQKNEIENIFQKGKIFEIIEFIRDYNNIERVVKAKNG